MSSKKSIVVSVLSSCLLLSSSTLVYGKTISEDPIAANDFSSILDEKKLNEAKQLYGEILDKYNNVCVQLKNATETLQAYGISVDDAECVYKAVKSLLGDDDVRIDCDLLEVVLSTLPELKNREMLKFMLENHNSQKGQQKLGDLLVDLRRFVKVKDGASVKEKMEWERHFGNKYEIRISRWNCDEMLSTLEAGNNLMITAGQESAYQVLNMCRKLQCSSSASLGLAKFLPVLRRYPQQEKGFCEWLEPVLRDAVNCRERFSYLEPIVDGNKNLKDYDQEQRGVLKTICDFFVPFRDTSDKGKAERALSNYVKDLNKVAKKIRNWK